MPSPPPTSVYDFQHTTKRDAEETNKGPASVGPVSAAPTVPTTTTVPVAPAAPGPPTASTSPPSRDVPPQHLCPITKCPMEDPAVASDGYTYER